MSISMILGLYLGFSPIQAQHATQKTLPTTANQEFDSMLHGLLKHSVKEVGVSECPSPEQAVFLDARSESEYQVSHIPTARWVGFSAFKEEDVEALDRDKPVVVYCSVGYRSEKITQRLQGMGFTNVMNLYGGIFAWKNQGKEVVNPQGQPTDQVHTYNKKWGQWLLKGTKVH